MTWNPKTQNLLQSTDISDALDKAIDYLDSAVRYVIIILIFVFDPLAVLMLIAANMSLKEEQQKRKRKERKSQPKNAMTTKVTEDHNTGMRKVVKEKNGVQIEYYE